MRRLVIAASIYTTHFARFTNRGFDAEFSVPFGDPGQTPYDVHFRLLGFPVRIHPFFWVVCVLLSGSSEPRAVLIWTVCVGLSILIHELGHALLQRHYGGEPYIVLYSFGGLAYGNGVELTPLRQILIALAGPFAGFVFASLLAMGIALSGHLLQVDQGFLIFDRYDSPILNLLLFDLLYINIWWGLLNLLPIYPLDGGQVARELFTLRMPAHRGIVASLWLSIACAGGVAAMALMTGGSLFRVLMFGILAYNNYQTLEAYRQSRGGGW